MRKFLLVMSTLLLCSCATINQKDSTILVDSEERGVEVTLLADEQKKKVVSPSIVAIEADRKFNVK